MPRQESKLEFNTFVKGLITEASPLTYPENASLIDENFVLNKDGSRQRRPGMEYEDNYVLKEIDSIQRTNNVINTYTWRSVNNDGDFDIAVLQVGNNIWFYENNQTIISNSILNSGNPLNLSTASIDRKFEFTESYGKLIIATGEEQVYIVSYDFALDTISSVSYRLTIRDTFGIDDGGSINYRPTTITNLHHYNLVNQGWHPRFSKEHRYSSVICSSTALGGSGILTDPIDYTFSSIGAYPSNADLIHAAKLGSAQNIYAIGAYSPWELEKLNLGTTNAPKGFLILDLFNRGADRIIWMNTLSSGIPNDETRGGINSIAAYAGRIFYSIEVTSTNGTDIRSPNLGSMILFSKSTDNILELGQCYSTNDPTAEDLNDPLDTDGGYITISDIGKIYKMAVMGSALYIFSSKGVWQVSGGDTYFSATNQVITKIDDFGVSGSSSVVIGENTLSFWSSGGIHIISLSEDGIRPAITNITQNTITSLYDGIDNVAKTNIVGTYDNISKQFRWLYREGNLPSNKYFNRELIFDTNIQSFYVNKFQEFSVTTGTCPYVVGYLDLSSSIFTDEIENIIVGINNVEVGANNQVFTTIRRSNQTTKSATKYWTHRDKLTGNKADITVSSLSNLDYKDWINVQDISGNYGKDALAILLTGYLTGGEPKLDKKAREITVYMKRTEEGFTDGGSGNLIPIHPSGCYLQAQWEWTNHVNAGRWSDTQQVYKLPRPYIPTGVGDPFNYGFTVVKTKNKLRGRGSALSLLFTSEPGKDCHIYGWSLPLSVDTK